MTCSNIKLSIIIPLYNVENYIERCLSSIFIQNDVQDYIEVIIVDDGSPDESYNVAAKLIINHSNSKIISQVNKGLGGARNTGFKKSSGKYVWFVDSDDEIARCSIKNIITHLELKSDIFIYDYELVNKEANKVNLYHSVIINENGYEITKKFLAILAWIQIYNREFLIKNGIEYREHFFHEDVDFSMKTMFLAQKVSYFDTVIYRYHVDNDQSIMKNIGIENVKDLLKLRETKEALVLKYNLTKDDIACIDSHLNTSFVGILADASFMMDKDKSLYLKLIHDNISYILKQINTSSKFRFKIYGYLFCLNSMYVYIIWNKLEFVIKRIVKKWF